MGWKIYFWLFTAAMIILTGLSIAESLDFYVLDEGDPLLDEPWNWLDWIDTLVLGISLVGLFGIAHQKTIGKQSFWRKWFVFLLIFDIAITVHEYDPSLFDTQEPLGLMITFSIFIALILPFYIALYLYGYSDSLWNSKSTLPR